MKRHLLALGIALSLGLNASAAVLELKNRNTWDTIITGATDYARFGNAMIVGDFNGDGKPDLAVGSREEDSPRGILNTGAVSIFFGGSTFQTLKNLSVDSAGDSLKNANATFFGAVGEYAGDVLAVGDLDGDGFDDLIIAAQKNGNYTTNKIYVLYGSATGLTTNMSVNNAQAVLKPPSMHVSGMATGDVDGDGIADLAIVDNYNNKVYVVYGSKTRKTGTIDLSTASDAIISRSSIDAKEMASIAIGDLDNDGKKDLAIGVPEEGDATTGLTGNGKVFICFGRGSALPKTLNLDTDMNVTILGGRKEERLGNSLNDGNYLNSLAFGDVNGDGIADLIMGSSQAWLEGMSSSTGGGKVQVLFGKPNLPSTIDLYDQYNIKMTVSDSKTYLGANVKVADLNGDGIGDIIISAPSAGVSSHGNGWIYVVYGKKNVTQTSIDLMKSADLIIQAPDPVHALAGASYGQTLAIADFDGDGKPDLVGGAMAGSYLGGIAKGYALMISNPVGKATASTATIPSATLEQINGRLVVTIPSAKVVNYLGNIVASFRLFVDLPNITLDPTSVVTSGVAESSNPAILDLGTNPFELRIPLLTFGSDKYMVNLKVSNDFSTFTIATIEPR